MLQRARVAHAGHEEAHQRIGRRRADGEADLAGALNEARERVEAFAGERLGLALALGADIGEEARLRLGLGEALVGGIGLDHAADQGRIAEHQRGADQRRLQADAGQLHFVLGRDRLHVAEFEIEREGAEAGELDAVVANLEFARRLVVAVADMDVAEGAAVAGLVEHALGLAARQQRQAQQIDDEIGHEQSGAHMGHENNRIQSPAFIGGRVPDRVSISSVGLISGE